MPVAQTVRTRRTLDATGTDEWTGGAPQDDRREAHSGAGVHAPSLVLEVAPERASRP